MSDGILISTGARLHFGFFAHGGAERTEPGSTNYGGVGLMIDGPGVVLGISRKPEHDNSQADLVEIRDDACDPAQVGERSESSKAAARQRVTQLVANYRSHCPANRQPPPCRIEVRSVIPPHQGLGSGTQLGMAVACGLSKLAGESNVDRATLARRVGRGARSAIGIHGFASGGFLIDAGKRSGEEIGSLAARVEVPAAWRMLLVTPESAGTGLSGQEESEILSQLSPMSSRVTEHLSRLALLEMLPALAARDCDRFGEAVFEFGRIVGEYFRPIQGGTYATESTTALVGWLRGQGIRGVAQTSWGPTLAVCCADRPSAERLSEKLHAESRWRSCRTRMAVPLNTGATIRSFA